MRVGGGKGKFIRQCYIAARLLGTRMENINMNKVGEGKRKVK